MESLGRYSLHGLIGSGGMGEVYRATDTSLLRDVALKLPHRHLGLDPRSRARFLQEGQVVAGLSHENIVHLYDLGEAEDRLYLAMEWVEGQTLEGWLAALGPMPALTAYALLLQLLAGLAAAHAKGIMHRDVKPANLLLTREGVLKIADFGLSRLLLSEDLSLSGQFLGTPKYASPELTRGETVTQKSDVHAVGLIALEMLAGQPVITAENPQAALLQIREGRFASSLEICPGAPSIIHATLASLLQERAESRPTAQEALTALETFAWEHRLRLNPARIASFIDSPQTAKASETRELAALWLEEAGKAKAAGKVATAHRYQRLAESLGSGTEYRQPGLETDTNNTNRLEVNRKRGSIYATYAAIALALFTLLGAAGFLWLKPWRQEPFHAAPAKEKALEQTQPKILPEVAADSLSRPKKSKGSGLPSKPAIHLPAKTMVSPIPSGWVRILSRPSFARIEIDGLALGATPSGWLPLSPGRHIMNLHRENCHSMRETLWVAPAESLDIRRELLRLP